MSRENSQPLQSPWEETTRFREDVFSASVTLPGGGCSLVPNRHRANHRPRGSSRISSLDALSQLRDVKWGPIPSLPTTHLTPLPEETSVFPEASVCTETKVRAPRRPVLAARPAPRAHVDHPDSGETARRSHWTLLSGGQAPCPRICLSQTPPTLPGGLAQPCPIAAQTPRLWSRVHTPPALTPLLPHSKQAF